MNSQNKNIKILLVCDNEADTYNIKSRVEDYDNILCYVWQCPTLAEGLVYLDVKKLRADIIILDLGLKGLENSKEIYRQMRLSAHNIPIIIITGKGQKEHELATFVMESGAADNIIRGEFSGLTDAIEFALIRQKITKNRKIETDRTLQESQNENDVKNLKERQDHQDNLSIFMGDYSASNHYSKDRK